MNLAGIRRCASKTTGRIVGLWAARRANEHITRPDSDALGEEWRADLDTLDKRDARAEAIGRAYDGAISRGVRVEAKALGILQIAAIVAAVIALVLTRSSVLLAIPAMISILYLFAATWGALEALRIRARPQLLVRNARSETGGLAETAAAAAGLEIDGIFYSNFVDRAFVDIGRAGIAALFALVLMVFGVGAAGSGPQSRRLPTVAATSTTRATSVSTTSTSQTPPPTTIASSARNTATWFGRERRTLPERSVARRENLTIGVDRPTANARVGAENRSESF